MTTDPYDALTDHDDDARWAYGTGFADPLSGVDTALPASARDRARLTEQCLTLGDDALVMSHRLQQWCTRAPELEDELALANIGLDLLGQARHLLRRAGAAEGAGRDEDALAFGRDAAGFRNSPLAERADPDFAHLAARLLAFSTWRLAVLTRLTSSPDPVLAAIAAKAVKEITYHRDYAARWVIRLGDGTALSHERMQEAVDALWPLLGDLPGDAGAVDEFWTVMAQVLSAATLAEPPAPSAGVPSATPPAGVPSAAPPAASAGVPSAALAEILGELQSVARAHPGGVW